jgi:F0F1-type ATP synthase membrane subunit b/b'
MLPGIVKSMLPDILHSSLAPRRSQSASPPILPSCPQSSTSLDVLLADRLKDLAKDHLTSIFDNANDHAYSLRNQADAEFEDAVADHKIDVDTIKEDCIHELGEVANDKLWKFKDQAREIVESAVEELESKTCGIRDDICEGLEDFVKAASSSLQKVRASNTARAQTASTT